MNARDDQTNKVLENYKTKTDARLDADEGKIGEVDSREKKNYEELKEENADLKTKLKKERDENLLNPVHMSGAVVREAVIKPAIGLVGLIGKGIDGLGKTIFKPKHEKKVSDTLCNK